MSPEAPPRVLVTGASGFIGSALVNRLLNDAACSVVATTRRKNPELPSRLNVVRTGELSPDTDWRTALKGVDVVIHLAARAHILKSGLGSDLEEFRRVNVAGTLNLANQAMSEGAKRFIFLSSIGVNGNQTFGRPFNEASPPNPIEEYAISKFEAENGLSRIVSQADRELVVIRPPLVYGKNAPGNFARFLRLVSRRFPLPFGSLVNKRSFIAIENLVDLIITCIDHPAAANQLFLASDGEDVSTVQFIRRIGAAFGASPILIPVPVWLLHATGTIFGVRKEIQRLSCSLQIDNTKARTLLNWRPPLNMIESLDRVANLGQTVQTI